jgi:hypothetical protein
MAHNFAKKNSEALSNEDQSQVRGTSTKPYQSLELNGTDGIDESIIEGK